MGRIGRVARGGTAAAAGATPAPEAIIAVESIRHGCLPPTTNLRETDPDIPLDAIQGAPRAGPVDAVLSTSLESWGMAGALVLAAER
jgi:3-oxoacyl-[acyl-carrier-protein] synthase II